MNQHVKKFCNKYDITEAQYYGKKWICKHLDIDEKKIPLGFNPKILYDLSIKNAKTLPKTFNPIVRKSLYLDKLKEISGNFNPIVGVSLYLDNVEKISGNFNPIVGSGLHFHNLKEILGNFNPIVGYGLYLHNLEEITENFNPIIGYTLHLDKIKKLPPNFSIKIGSSLHLKNLEKIPENFNPVIGEYLFLNSLEKLPEKFNPIVGKKINYNITPNFDKYNSYRSTNIPPSPISWENGKYISVDGILSEVIYKKGKIYKVKDIYRDKESFVVTDGNGTYSHGFTLKKAKEDLSYKINKNRKLEPFKSLTLDSKLSFEKAIECYRTITGACELGIKKFLKQEKIKPIINKTLSIKEIIDITEGNYGNFTFKQFFDN